MPFQPASPSPRTAPRSDLSDDALTEVLRSVVHDVSKLHGIPRSDVQCRIQVIPGLDDTEFVVRLGIDHWQAMDAGFLTRFENDFMGQLMGFSVRTAARIRAFEWEPTPAQRASRFGALPQWRQPLPRNGPPTDFASTEAFGLPTQMQGL